MAEQLLDQPPPLSSIETIRDNVNSHLEPTGLTVMVKTRGMSDHVLVQNNQVEEGDCLSQHNPLESRIHCRPPRAGRPQVVQVHHNIKIDMEMTIIHSSSLQTPNTRTITMMIIQHLV
jgi:hypothetical protein